MERRVINTLVVNDDDLNCRCDQLTLGELNIGNLGFVNVDLERFDMIIYSGKRGTKILRSRYTKAGIIQ